MYKNHHAMDKIYSRLEQALEVWDETYSQYNLENNPPPHEMVRLAMLISNAMEVTQELYHYYLNKGE